MTGSRVTLKTTIKWASFRQIQSLQLESANYKIRTKRSQEIPNLYQRVCARIEAKMILYNLMHLPFGLQVNSLQKLIYCIRMYSSIQ